MPEWSVKYARRMVACKLILAAAGCALGCRSCELHLPTGTMTKLRARIRVLNLERKMDQQEEAEEAESESVTNMPKFTQKVRGK